MYMYSTFSHYYGSVGEHCGLLFEENDTKGTAAKTSVFLFLGSRYLMCTEHPPDIHLPVLVPTD